MKCIHNKDGKEITRTGQTTSWTYHTTGDSGGVQPSPPEDSGGGSSSGPVSYTHLHEPNTVNIPDMIFYSFMFYILVSTFVVLTLVCILAVMK